VAIAGSTKRVSCRCRHFAFFVQMASNRLVTWRRAVRIFSRSTSEHADLRTYRSLHPAETLTCARRCIRPRLDALTSMRNSTTAWHYSVSFAKSPAVPSSALLVPRAVAHAALQRLVPSGFFACRPCGFAAQRKIPPAWRPCWPVLPPRSSPPPAVAPCGFMLARRCAVK
jgi:hypothetical protein